MMAHASSVGRLVLLLGLAIASIATDVHPTDKYWISGSAKAVGALEVAYEVKSNLPPGATLSATLMLQQQDPKGIYIGTNFQRVPWNGVHATGRIDGARKPTPLSVALPAGDYWLELAFYPRWPENAQIAAKLQVAEPIKYQIPIKLAGSGTTEQTARSANAGRRWVMENVRPDDVWDIESWRKRFGKVEQLHYRGSLNPNIVAAYWIESIDVTVQVNKLTGKIIAWRLGRNEL